MPITRSLLCLLVVLLVVGCATIGTVGERQGLLHVGIFADLHAHDTDSPLDQFVLTGWAERLQACVDAMNEWPADLMIQLGDFVNGRFVLGAEFGDPERIPGILEAAEAVYAGFGGPRHHVLGNHDVEDLTKAEFLDRVNIDDTAYSFDAGAYHFVILDAQYRLDGTDRENEFWFMQGYVPPFLLDWLREDLAATDGPAIVCMHQRLDLDFELRHGGPEIANHLEVRNVLVEAGNVIAVFHGHDHGGGYSEIDGIHYVTFHAALDRTWGKPPTWAFVTLDPEARTIAIDGAGVQPDLTLHYEEVHR
jgi:3',5'-cyclic AMP phosphodiesterase CpdA